MIASVLLSLAASSAPSPFSISLSFSRAPIQDAGADEYTTRLEAAGDDATELWELHTWCKEQGKIMQARECLKKIVDLKPDHAEARKALGHHLYDGQWFKSYYDLSEYKRAEEKRMLDEKGLVRFNDDWVPVADEPYLRMGMVKEAATGKWITKREFDRRAQEAKYEAEGWKQQTDGVWVPPDEVSNWEKSLWKCGDQWFDLEAANAYHSKLGQWWTVPSSGNLFEMWSTCPYETTWRAGNFADAAYPDLLRAYGVRPDEKPVVVVLNSQAQYNEFAMGNQQLGVAGTESQGFSSIHYAFFAESWFLPTQPPEYVGTGIAVWNVGEKPDPYARHAVPHAAALAYAESIDPSLNSISRLTTPGQQFPFLEFWLEKKIPLWFRVGVAAYCERYFYDVSARPEEGHSPWWARDWSLDNIRRRGGPKPFEEIFAMALNPNDVEGSAMLINQAGMVVSFILDGKCAPVVQAHEALKAALRSKGDTAQADADLRAALLASKDDFSLFVKM